MARDLSVKDKEEESKRILVLWKNGWFQVWDRESAVPEKRKCLKTDRDMIKQHEGAPSGHIRDTVTKYSMIG